MGMRKKPSAERLHQISARQDTPKWGSEYEPAIYATREEAPSISRAAQIYSDFLGRDLHALSGVETEVLPFALYHRDTVDVLEQKVLNPGPAPHPLASHPLCVGQRFPSMRGTVFIAESLGLLKHHPKLRVNHPTNHDEVLTVPYPWIGDILLVLGGRDSLYAVNWSIKSTPEQFVDPNALGVISRNYDESAQKLHARHLIEEIYYLDGGIRTVHITRADYSQKVAANLRQLYLWHARATPFDGRTRQMVLDHFHAGLVSRHPPDLPGPRRSAGHLPAWFSPQPNPCDFRFWSSR